MHSDCVTDGLVPDGMVNQGTQMPVLIFLGIGYPWIENSSRFKFFDALKRQPCDYTPLFDVKAGSQRISVGFVLSPEAFLADIYYVQQIYIMYLLHKASHDSEAYWHPWQKWTQST